MTEAAHDKLGKHPTPVIWVLVFVIFAGTGLAGIAIIFDSLPLFIVGVALTAIGGIASLAAGIMSMTE